MADFAAYNETALQSLIGDLREAFRAHGAVRGRYTAGKKRSLSQNDISHVWYEQMAREDRQDDARGHRRYCKLHHGVPILRAEDGEFRMAYDAVIRPLSYELKLVAMDHWPVTSLMNKSQMTAYLEAVQSDYRARGVLLEFPMERAA
jgi:hypothetical protein